MARAWETARERRDTGAVKTAHPQRPRRPCTLPPPFGCESKRRPSTVPPAVLGKTRPAAQRRDGSRPVPDRSAGRSRRCRAGRSTLAATEAAAALGPDRIGCIDLGLSGESQRALSTTENFYTGLTMNAVFFSAFFNFWLRCSLVRRRPAQLLSDRTRPEPASA